MESGFWDDINRWYTAQLILTPAASLTCWEAGSPKDSCLDGNGNLKYDVIPVTENGKIVGVMTKQQPFEPQPIGKEWLIAHDTPVSDLVKLFADTHRPSFLTRQGNEISGLITPADLNKLPMRSYIYALIGQVEIALSRLIREELGDTLDVILPKIGANRAREIRQTIKTSKINNVDVDAIEHLYLSDMLSIIEKTPSLREQLGFTSRSSAKNELGGLNELRNQTMHVVRPLLSEMPKDLVSLQKRLQRIRLILELEKDGTPDG